MARVLTTVVPTLHTFPWSGARGEGPSIRPIAELLAFANGAAITISGVGDTQQIQVLVTLPVNYTYAWVYANAAIVGAGAKTADNWEDDAALNYTTSGTFVATSWISAGASEQTGNWVKSFRLPEGTLPNTLLRGGDPVASQFMNLSTDDIAVTFSMTLRFLVYTVVQEFDTAVNTPILVR